MTSERPVTRLGPILLSDGVTRTNCAVLLLGGMVTYCLTAYLNFAQPYILSVNLNIPEGERGQLTGNLAFWNEFVLIAMASTLGALSDRIGRRAIFVAGALIMALGYALYATAETVGQLYIYRLVFAVGAACTWCMLMTVLADYPREESRGKLMGIIGSLIGIGMITLVVALSSMPSWLIGKGYSPLEAGQYSFLTVSAIYVVAAGALALGLKGGAPGVHEHVSIIGRIKTGLSYAREPRIAIALASGFIARGDIIVVGAYFSLWIEQVGTGSGMTSAEALARAGMLYAIVQGSGLFFSPAAGAVIDRMNRLSGLCLATLLAGAGFIAMGMVDDPLGWYIYPAAILLGLGQSSGITASQTLIGQEAPDKHRGAVMGLYNLCGGIGILVVSLASGFLYDNWHPAGPFVFMGMLNLCVAAAGLSLRAGQRREMKLAQKPAE